MNGKVAVIGSGIAGLSCAWKLAQEGAHPVLYEAGDWFGGHTHTVDVTLDGVTHGVDTGFLVFNDRTYPALIKLFAQLGVPSVASDMSFAVKLPGLEWAGSSLDTVFAQRRNLLRPSFLRMLGQILRFNREATAAAMLGRGADTSLGEFLDAGGYDDQFRNWYLLPMAACIWSCPPRQMLEFPLPTFVRFCHNHGLLQVNDRPQWRTVPGGARQYVERMLAGVEDKRLATPVLAVERKPGVRHPVQVHTAQGSEGFDEVVLACHSDQALQLLQEPRAEEREVLSAVRYQPNRAVLHTDAACLPVRQKAWSAWNYESDGGAEPQVCVHYLLNKLQPLPFKQPVIVSLNPLHEPDAAKVIGSYDYSHPVFDARSTSAQAALPLFQGRQHTWFAGAWTGYGFHEDGLRSGLAAADGILQRIGAREHAAA
jgi:predicted NAD/FAD-binding protein